jgi:hypothetical protein
MQNIANLSKGQEMEAFRAKFNSIQTVRSRNEEIER